MATNHYRAIFFDAGGTLFYPHPSVGAIYAKVAAGHGANVEAGRIDKVFKAEFGKRDKLGAERAHASEKNEKEWWRSLVRDVFRQVGDVQGFDDFFEELYDLFASHEVWRVFPDVIPALESLREGPFIFGIVSNWDSRLPAICSGMGVEKYFDFILASAMVKAAKPGKKIFEHALERAGVLPHEALHVGDSLEDDYRGAQKAGLDALLVNRSGVYSAETKTIRSLTELSELVGVA